MRLISVNGETAVHHVDEKPWKCTIRLLSGSDFRGLTLPNTIFQKLTFPQVKKGFRSIRTEPFLTEENA